MRGLARAARQRFVWLVLALAVINMVLTPLTTSAGQWLYNQESEHRPILQKHEELGETMVYYSIALLVVAVAIAVLHVLAHRTDKTRTVVTVLVAVAAVLVGASSIVGVVDIGHTGAEAKWGAE